MLLVIRRLLWRLSLALLSAMTVLTLFPLPATAHPSDFRTLTLDLIFGPEGLEAVDAAVVEATGPNYEPFPSAELRQAVAEKVLAALDVGNSSASIDAEMSERYHQVGFLVTFEEPRPGQGEAFRFDTDQLQAIAKDTNLDWLKLSLCAEDSETFNELEIQASTDGRAPADNTSERSWCQIWNLGTTDAPVTISVRSSVLPMTGLPVVSAGIAGLVLLAGGLLILRRQRSTSSA
jgi:LPXTG-motif cell wall-anchored protein